jgi:hypothetical protein
MEPLNEMTSNDYVGRKVRFRTGADHAGCWHFQTAVVSGIVLRVAQTLAQKAELLRTEGIDLPEWLSETDEVPRLWVKVDPCASFPRGCEAAVEPHCLTLMDASFASDVG